jgi:hypothetical protein
LFLVVSPSVRFGISSDDPLRHLLSQILLPMLLMSLKGIINFA